MGGLLPRGPPPEGTVGSGMPTVTKFPDSRPERAPLTASFQIGPGRPPPKTLSKGLPPITMFSIVIFFAPPEPTHTAPETFGV